MALYYGRTVNDIAQELSTVNKEISINKRILFYSIDFRKNMII